jgi:hypothetical protein
MATANRNCRISICMSPRSFKNSFLNSLNGKADISLPKACLKSGIVQLSPPALPGNHTLRDQTRMIKHCTSFLGEYRVLLQQAIPVVSV